LSRKDKSPIVFGDVTVDPRTYTGTKGGRSFRVSARELELLCVLAAHDGQVIERFALLDHVWGIRYLGTTRTLDQHVAKLRRKIEDDPSRPRFIQTVHGIGYRFDSSPS
jgi:DNA-binding response OmpR family regulator